MWPHQTTSIRPLTQSKKVFLTRWAHTQKYSISSQTQFLVRVFCHCHKWTWWPYQTDDYFGNSLILFFCFVGTFSVICGRHSLAVSSICPSVLFQHGTNHCGDNHVNHKDHNDNNGHGRVCGFVGLFVVRICNICVAVVVTIQAPQPCRMHCADRWFRGLHVSACRGLPL